MIDEKLSSIAAHPYWAISITLGALVVAMLWGIILPLLYYFFVTKFGANKGALKGLRMLPPFTIMKEFIDGGVMEITRQLSSDGTGGAFDDAAVNFNGFMDGHPAIVVCQPEGIRRVLLEHETFRKHPAAYDAVKPLLGNGLVLTTGELWARQRKLLTPLFHLRKLRSYIPLINDEARRLCALFESRGAGGATALDCGVMYADAAQRMVMRSVFGERVDLDEQTELWATVTEGLFVFFGATLVFPTWLLTRFPFGSIGGFNRSLARFAHTTRAKIAAIRAAPDSTADTDLLSQMALMRDDNGEWAIDAELIVDECKTINFAGRDTTSNTMAWLSLYLARHPEWLARLRAESDQVGLGADNFVDEATLNKLVLHRAAVREALRLRPPVPFLERLVDEPTTIAGVTVPAGSAVVAWLLAAQHSRAIWGQDAAEFNPARFVDGDAERSPFSFLPFSAGSRNCVGQKMALQEAVIMLAHIAQNFEKFTGDNLDSIKEGFQGTVEPRNLKLRFIPRVK